MKLVQISGGLCHLSPGQGPIIIFFVLLNPVTTDDTVWCRQILAASYQLSQSVLKVGSALAERVGQGGGWIHRSA